jgi:hypothetical protein
MEEEEDLAISQIEKELDRIEEVEQIISREPLEKRSTERITYIEKRLNWLLQRIVRLQEKLLYLK